MTHADVCPEAAPSGGGDDDGVAGPAGLAIIFM